MYFLYFDDGEGAAACRPLKDDGSVQRKRRVLEHSKTTVATMKADAIAI